MAKPRKSSSSLSFNSLSSSLRASVSRFSEERSASVASRRSRSRQDAIDDFAIVDRDGKTSSDREFWLHLLASE